MVLEEMAVEADAFVEAVMGPDVWRETGHRNAATLWRACMDNARREAAPSWRQLLDWVPERLFDAINLPTLTVNWPKEHDYDKGTNDEDIALLFGVCAPGNITRRFGKYHAHWLVPNTRRRAPLLPDVSDYADSLQCQLLSDGDRRRLNNDEQRMSAELLARLAVEVHAHLAGKQSLYHKLFRPEKVTLSKAGSFDKDHSRWQPDYFWDGQQREVVHADDRAGRKLQRHPPQVTILVVDPRILAGSSG